MYVWDIRLRRAPSGHMMLEQLCCDVCLGHTPSEGTLWSHDIWTAVRWCMSGTYAFRGRPLVTWHLNSCAVMYVWDIRLWRVPSGHMTFEQLCSDVCLGHTPSDMCSWFWTSLTKATKKISATNLNNIRMSFGWKYWTTRWNLFFYEFFQASICILTKTKQKWDNVFTRCFGTDNWHIMVWNYHIRQF